MFPLFATGVIDTGGKFAAGVVDTSGKLPPVSLTPVAPVSTSVSDPDPDWIRIQSDHWIRIRNLNTDLDPDPGGQK